VTYMSWCYKKYGDKIAKLCATVKVHKAPWKLWPVVSKCGTLLECISKLLDYKLQNLSKFMPTVIKDSKSLRDDIISLNLSPTAKLFTADATSLFSVHKHRTKPCNASHGILAWISAWRSQTSWPKPRSLKKVEDEMG
jgi:hypothetical protein